MALERSLRELPLSLEEDPGPSSSTLNTRDRFLVVRERCRLPKVDSLGMGIIEKKVRLTRRISRNLSIIWCVLSHLVGTSCNNPLG